jgi:hypothetical protein
MFGVNSDYLVPQPFGFIEGFPHIPFEGKVMAKRKKRMARRVGLVLLSVIGAAVGLCLGAVIFIGIIQVYSSN